MRNRFMLGAASAALLAIAFAAPASAQQSDPPGDATTQARLAVGQDTNGALDAPEDVDWYRLSVERGQRYTLSLDAAPAEGQEPIDPVLIVRGADGADLTYNDDANGTLNSQLFFSPQQSGEVFVDARAFDPQMTGPYVLRVSAETLPADDAGNGADTRARVAPGQTLSGAIEFEGDSDWYRLSARTGQIYRIALNGAEGRQDALGDPVLRIVDREGQDLAVNDDHEGLNSYLEFAPARSGDVFVVAGAYADAYAGAYTLSVEAQRLPPDNASADVNTRGRLQVGQGVEQTLDYGGDTDWYRIRLEGGQVYTFTLRSAGEAPLRDPVLVLYDAQGTQLTADDDGGGGLDSQIEYVAPASGNYFLEARGYAGDMTGSYRLSARAGDTPADASTDVSLQPGDYREAVLAPAGDRDWYRLELNGGDAVRVMLMSAESADALGDPYIVVYGPDGQELARDDDSGEGLNAWLELQAPASGAYFIEARGFGEDAAGRYYLAIAPGEIPAAADGAEPLTPGGEARTSTIGAAGDVDWFALELVEGRPYRFNLRGLDPNALADPYLALYNANGERVAADDDGGPGLNAYLSYASPTGGPHFLAVSSYTESGTGNYMVSASDTDVPGNGYTDESLDAAGDERASSIDMPGDIDFYMVELEGGATYLIDVAGTGEHPLADPFLTVSDGEGASLTTDDDGGPGLDARVRFRPQQSGVYFIQASGLGGSTGSYRVTILRQ